jgi:hypothetical protein
VERSGGAFRSAASSDSADRVPRSAAIERSDGRLRQRHCERCGKPLANLPDPSPPGVNRSQLGNFPSQGKPARVRNVREGYL